VRQRRRLADDQRARLVARHGAQLSPNGWIRRFELVVVTTYIVYM
jgi:hypothetical protein